jgi:hypothetical protein
MREGAPRDTGQVGMALRKKIGGLWAASAQRCGAGMAATQLRDLLEVIGRPEPGGMNFQPASPVRRA